MLHLHNTEFNNKLFWENRYLTNPELGSGVGSRGELLLYKRNLISEIKNEYQSRSVLDVGCGDLEVIDSIPFENYIGIDISPTVILRNASMKPYWRFVSGDFVSLQHSIAFEAELVICMDVLIHQHDYKYYCEFVKCLTECITNIGLISGFEDPPRLGFTSDITAYHEPLTETLARFGINDVQKVGEYRDLVVLLCHRKT